MNDATRTNYTASVLDTIYPLLRRIEKLRFLVASGTHLATTGQELAKIFVSHLPFAKGRLALHNPNERNALEHVGTTTRGTEVWLNRLVTAARRVLVIGNVVPHYFAGYSGGRKSVIPGTAGYGTVEANPRHAQRALDEAIVAQGKEPMVVVMPNAELCVPITEPGLTIPHRR